MKTLREFLNEKHDDYVVTVDLKPWHVRAQGEKHAVKLARAAHPHLQTWQVHRAELKSSWDEKVKRAAENKKNYDAWHAKAQADIEKHRDFHDKMQRDYDSHKGHKGD